MEQLKKCPFCGGKAKLEQIASATWDKFVVTCNSSKCCAFYIGYCDEGLYETKEKAIIAWNTRKPMEQIVERLELLQDMHGQREEDAREAGLTMHADLEGAKAYVVEEAIEIVKEEM